jgi:hypothetical protein
MRGAGPGLGFLMAASFLSLTWLSFVAPRKPEPLSE